MSTKTSIKRIALVAAAALAIGGFSAVSANAAASTITQVAGTGDNGAGGIAGPANTLKVLVTHATSSAGFVSITGGTILSASNSNTVAANGLSVLLSASNATDTLTIATPTAGSLVVNVYDEVTAGSGTFPAAVSTTKTITISATGVSGVFSAAKSSVYIASGRATTGVALTADAAAITASSQLPSSLDSTTVAATIQVGYFDGAGAAMNNAADTITATIISGPGVIGGNVDSTTTGASAIAATYTKSLGTIGATSGIYSFYLYANGQTGTTVVSFKNSAGTVIGSSKSMIFAGTVPARIEATVVKKAVLNSATGTDKVLSVKLYDAATGGNAIPSLANAITGKVATGSLIGGAISSCPWNATALVYYCTVGAAATPTTAGGTEVYTLSAGTGVTTTASVNFVNGIATSVSVAGPASADPGSKVTYVLTATGLADGAYAPGSIFTNADPVTNVSLAAGAVPFGKDETITVVDGVATDFTYAPFGGSLSISWTLAGPTAGTAQAVGNISIAAATFSAAGLDKAITKTAVAAEDVTISANTEATAAANAATDAANQAADAADNATQAAAEALAAVNTLATTVATLIDGIKNQIKALNTLILAIKKKIKA